MSAPVVVSTSTMGAAPGDPESGEAKLKDFFRLGQMAIHQKEKFEAFAEQCRSNPSLLGQRNRETLTVLHHGECGPNTVSLCSRSCS
jgi:hypothetical protein